MQHAEGKHILLKSLLEWGAVPSYQQGQKNILSAVDLGECMVACIFGAEKLESWDIDASKIRDNLKSKFACMRHDSFLGKSRQSKPLDILLFIRNH